MQIRDDVAGNFLLANYKILYLPLSAECGCSQYKFKIVVRNHTKVKPITHKLHFQAA